MEEVSIPVDWLKNLIYYANNVQYAEEGNYKQKVDYLLGYISSAETILKLKHEATRSNETWT